MGAKGVLCARSALSRCTAAVVTETHHIATLSLLDESVDASGEEATRQRSIAC